MALEEISVQLKKFVDSEIDVILNDISKNYNLNYDELNKKYLNTTCSTTPCNTENSSLPKKRGRKKKTKEEYIETQEFEYQGVTYLLDSKTNNIYSNNVEAPTLLGIKLIDGSINFHKKS